MYVYIQSEKYLWTVGFYDPSGRWIPESDHSTAEDAATRTAWLNGTLSEVETKITERLEALEKKISAVSREFSAHTWRA